MKIVNADNVLLIFIGSLLILSSCIEKFTPSLSKNDTQSLLVVEGLITDETGPFRVHLTKSGPVDQLYSPEPFTGADITIIDDKGNIYQLVDHQNGWYETEDKNLKGLPRTTYTLIISDGEGNDFESTQELLQDVPDIDSVYTEEVTKTRFENNIPIEDNWLNILLDTHDEDGRTTYWFWKFEETWEIRMPELVHVIHGSLESEHYYNYEPVVVEPEKEVCWVNKPSKSIIIKSTANSNESDITRFPIQSLGPGEDKLHFRYSILIKQYSLNRELYEYWNELKKINEDGGGIYTTLPVPVYGNIQSTSGTKKALGYFCVSGVKTKRIFINPDNHKVATFNPYGNCVYLTDPNPYIYSRWVYFTTIAHTDIKLWVYDDNYCTDCRARGTNIKPDFW
jgi:hypothetical protein